MEMIPANSSATEGDNQDDTHGRLDTLTAEEGEDTNGC